MAEALIFHFRDRQAFLNHCNPIAKLFCVLVLCLELVGTSFSQTLFFFCLLSLVAIVQKLPIHRYRSELFFFLFMTALIVVTEYLSSHDFAETMAAGLRFDTIIILGMLLADTTAPDDLARSLGSLLDRIPFVRGWVVASNIELTVSLIPLIFDVTQQVSTARKARGQTTRHPIGNIIQTTEAIFTVLLDKAEELSMAMDSRLFNSSQPRQSMSYGLRDIVLCLLCIATIGAGRYLT